jgi:chloramphenicol-sensitive protein RarD
MTGTPDDRRGSVTGVASPLGAIRFGDRPAAFGGSCAIQAAVSKSRRGLAHGITAYALWGIAPLYWKLPGLVRVSPVEVIAHRVVWGALAFAALAWLAGVGPAVRAAFRDPRTVAAMALSGSLVVVNWGAFVIAVQDNHLLDASLGYFINPLLSVALGMLVLRERLRPLQWWAIGSAVIGVGVLTWQIGRVPWLSLVVATSFGGYGLVRKLARVESLAGSTVETALLAPVAVAYLAIVAARGGGQLGHASAGTELLLLTTGVVTAVPLLLFTSAARLLPLSTVGFLQYLAPTTQFVLALARYDEPFSRPQLIAFSFIWLGLIAFSIDLARSPISRTDR